MLNTTTIPTTPTARTLRPIFRLFSEGFEWNPDWIAHVYDSETGESLYSLAFKSRNRARVQINRWRSAPHTIPQRADNPAIASLFAGRRHE